MDFTWTLVVVGNILPWSLPIVHIATGLAKVRNPVCNWGLQQEKVN